MSEADENSAKHRLDLHYYKHQVAAIRDAIAGSGVELMEVLAVSCTVSQGPEQEQTHFCGSCRAHRCLCTFYVRDGREEIERRCCNGGSAYLRVSV